MKTDKTKNWTDSWKEQLDKYSVTPPPEVWEELSKELAPRRIPFWKRTIWWTAACITLLLCTFIGLQFLRPTTDLNKLLVILLSTALPHMFALLTHHLSKRH